MQAIHDVIILGCGPAGIQAAIHAARKKADVLMLGRMSKSSLFWAHVENFCCQFKISGEEMLNNGLAQAAKFGAKHIEEDALHVARAGRHFKITGESGQVHTSRSLILATGTSRNKLGVPGEKEFLGRGVSYCVDCDGGFFRNEKVAVVGGLSAAAGGALTLTQMTAEVHLVSQTLEVVDALRERLKEAGVILHEGVEVKAVRGDGAVADLELSDGRVLDVGGVFIELGAKGVLELASVLGLELDESMKYVGVDRKQRSNVPGIFAAGDITGPPLQIAKAVGEGCVAGIEAAAHAKMLKDAQTQPKPGDPSGD